MRTFASFSVLLLLIASNDSKKVAKRHSLVSRFTSNPFFLRHFGGNHLLFQLRKPPTFAKPELNNIEVEEERDIEEEVKTTNNLDDTTEKIINISETNFNKSPQFEKTNAFRLTHVDEEKEEEEAGAGLYIFKSLPYFERRLTYQGRIEESEEEVKEAEETNSKPSIYIFKSLPSYDQAHLFQETNPQQPTEKAEESGANDASTSIFTSLPYFERRNQFLGPEFVSRGLSHLSHLSHGGHFPRKKLVKVIRKKIPGTEFRRKISIADLPLEENVRTGPVVFNSYGDIVSGHL